MGWRSLAVSFALHAVTGAALAMGLEAPERRGVRKLEPLEITTVPVPAPAPVVAPTVPESRSQGEAPPASTLPAPAPARPRGAREVKPPAGGGGRPGALAMRSVATREGRAADTEVRVPRPWELDGRQAAPPADLLPRGALDGEVRAPKPYVPTGNAERDSLGPRMKHDGDGGYVEDRAGFRARVDRDGTIHFRDKGSAYLGGEGAGTILTFDLTDAVLRALGDDPYAYEKMKIMERTREVRAGMKLRERDRALGEAAVKITGRLDRIWRQPTWTAAQRRRLIFMLWDEAAETGDAEVLRAATAVRALIVKFVRDRLPEASEDAFTDEELELLNRGRQSKERFAPYAP